MNRRSVYGILSALIAALVLSGCGVTKEDVLGPEKGWENFTSEQQMIVSDMAAPNNSAYDAGVAAMTGADYVPLEIVQLGTSYTAAFGVCGKLPHDDCLRLALPTSEQPYVMFDLTGKPADNVLDFTGTSYLLYPAGPTHNEHYSIRCDMAELKTEVSRISGLSPATVDELAELGAQVADKVAPIENVFGDQPETNLTVTSGNVYACSLAYEEVGALQ